MLFVLVHKAHISFDRLSVVLWGFLCSPFQRVEVGPCLDAGFSLPQRLPAAYTSAPSTLGSNVQHLRMS